MSTLIVHNQQEELTLTFEGKAKLSDLLTSLNVMPQTPCGGNGKCGKCAAFVYKENANLEETKILTCQVYVEGDTEIFIPKGTIVSKIQTMRKDSDFNVMDHIAVSITGSEKIKSILEKNSAEFVKAVLCDELIYSESDGISKDWNINGEDVVITVKRLS